MATGQPKNAPNASFVSRRKNLLFGCALVIATLVAYWPCLHGQFVWDDDAWTTNITDLLKNFRGLYAIWFHPMALQQYYPLTATTFWIDHHLWGFWTLPYHVENVLLHLTAVWLFWRLLRQLEVPGAWLAASIFALHPVMVESAGWITERKNVLSLVFFLSGLLAYGRYASYWKETDRAIPEKNRFAYGAAFLLLAAALLCKTTTFCFPAVVLLICWWKRGRIRIKADVLPVLPFFVLAIGLSYVTAWLEKNHVGATGPEFAMSFPARCLIAGRVFWFYIGKLLWPADLCFVYPHWQPDAHSVMEWLYPSTAVVTLVSVWLFRKKIGRGPATALFFFIGSLFPVLGFLNAYGMRFSYVWDHWVYLSSLGIFALVAALLARFIQYLKRPEALGGIAVMLLPMLAYLTFQQCGEFKDLETLWNVTLVRNPDAFIAHNNLGILLYQRGQREEALTHFQKALDLQPNFSDAHISMGNALLDLGRLDEAVTHFKQAIEANDEIAHNNLGIAYLRKGWTDEAIAEFRTTIQLSPEYASAHNNLALALVVKKDFAGAELEHKKAIQLQPDFVNAYYDYGIMLETQGKTDEALAQYRKTIELNPRAFEASFALAKLLAARNNADEAIHYYELTLAIRPDHFDAHNNLANLLVARGQVADAIGHYTKALQINPDHAEAHYNLGAALLAQNDVNGAIGHFQQAVVLKPEVAPFHNRLGLALQMNKNYAKAIEQFEAAVKLDPTYISAANNLAWLLATCADKSLRDGPRAVVLAQKVNLMATAESPEFLDTLSAAYAEAGQFAEATATVQRAIDLATSQGNASLASTLQARAKLYNENIAYHELP